MTEPHTAPRPPLLDDAPTQQRATTRALCLALALAMTASLAACDDHTAPDGDPKPTTPDTTTPSPELQGSPSHGAPTQDDADPTDDTLAPLREGIEADGERFQPMMVSLDRQQGANAWLTVGLREGKNREIRRAMQEIGLNVNRLLRVSYGPFQLGQLKEGEVEEVRPRILRDQLGLGPAPETEETPAKPGKPAAKRRPPRVPRRKP